MQILKFEKNSDEWLEARLGKIMGSKLGDLYSEATPLKSDITDILEENEIAFKKSDTIPVLSKLLTPEMVEVINTRAALRAPKKKEFYQLIADRIAKGDEYEDGIDAGHMFEAEALGHFAVEYKKIVDADPGMWVRDDDQDIGVSPDGAIANDKDVFTEAVEIKNLGSALHVEAIVTNRIPAKYRLKFHLQRLQYFIVNEDLQKHYLVFYDRRIVSQKMKVFETDRADVQAQIDFYLEYERKMLAEVNEWAERLAF